MNTDIQTLLNFIRQSKDLTASERNKISEEVKKIENELQDKNRDLEIEAALEQVRVVAMNMKQPADMLEICRIISEQLQILHVNEIRNIQTAVFYESKNIYLNYEYFNFHDKTTITEVDYNSQPDVAAFANQMLKAPDTFFNKTFTGKEVKDWVKYQEKANQYIDPKQYEAESIHYYFFSIGSGALGVSTYTPLNDDEIKLFKRFRNVFELAYRRYTDIEKAQEQAREAQMEASLERVRAKAMAMHNSSGLSEAAGTVFTELNKLGIHPIRSGFVLLTKDSRKAKLYPATSFDKTNTISFTGEFEFTGHEVFEKQYESWQKKENYFPVLEDEVLKSYYRILSEGLSVPYQNFPTDKKQFGSFLPFNEGFLFTWSEELYSEKEINILNRFKGILDLTIRRYLDLQKAEAQAHEAKIEASLERVRAKAMAMHSSEDLASTINSFYNELGAVSVTPRRCGVGLMDKKTRLAEISTMNTTEQGESIEIIGKLKMTGHPVLEDIFDNWLRQKEFHVVLRGQEIKKYYDVLHSHIQFPDYPHDVIQFGYYFMFPEGDVYAWTEKELSEEELQIYRKFTTVLSLTYKRYKDLRQAEAQAREAKIEAALERVRSKAMAMHKSDDLNAAVAIVFEELDKLNLGMLRCGIGILHKEKRCADVWTTTIGDQGRIVQVSGDESIDIHPLLQGAYDAWVKQGEFSYMLEGEDMSTYYRAVSATNFKLPESQSMIEHAIDLRQYYYACAFQSGNLFAFRETPFSDEAKAVMRRFADVFNLTYTRFNDLKQAELQTYKARIEVALERVRARALAMQQPEELVEVAEVMRHEMGSLGVEELETSSIYIHDESSSQAECWYALRDPEQSENKLISDHITMDLQQTWVGREMLRFYDSEDKTITIPMTGDNRKEWIKYCYALSKPFDKFYGEDIPDRTYHLYKFSNGAIGAAAPGNISEESWDLLKRTASVFSLAYSRFKDLTKARFDLHQLKEEKKRAEDALANLKITQAQLIQSEKMASLGELTAGIAHEIKNPLNFVNNFSELSNDLLDEFVNTTDESERKELAEDLKHNLSIINEHGKRADSIVKNMLEHSRTGTGKKQLTNINQLCEEFFNLAYHGIRANNPDFNCEMKKQLAPDLPQVNVVSQDISRVLLNLFNNAFYTVNEKNSNLKSQNLTTKNEYRPEVSLITQYTNNSITISVKDNGTGIPNHIKGKIFEPFFTTKPAGKGTGLGLSLSYDIITKGHGGELKLETKEGEGSMFIIILSVN